MDKGVTQSTKEIVVTLASDIYRTGKKVNRICRKYGKLAYSFMRSTMIDLNRKDDNNGK